MRQADPRTARSRPKRAGDPGEGADPALVWESIWGFGRTRALEAAVDARLFDRLAAGAATAAGLATRSGVSVRGARMVLDALVGMELLAKSGERYRLTDTARAYLVSDSPSSMARLVSVMGRFRGAWDGLEDALRSGEPRPHPSVGDVPGQVFPELVEALFPSSFGGATRARDALPARTRARVTRVLDVAAGSAAWSLPWAIANPDVRVTALDFPEVLEATRRYTDRFGVTDRYRFLERNLRDVRFGAARYDLVLLGQICHAEGARGARRLIEKGARALAPGGILLIADMIPNDRRTGPLASLLFGLNLLLHTGDGDVFTFAEYREWAEAAGLTAVRKLDLGRAGPDVVVATKPAR